MDLIERKSSAVMAFGIIVSLGQTTNIPQSLNGTTVYIDSGTTPLKRKLSYVLHSVSWKYA